MDEVRICHKYLDLSYTEVMNMPTYKRRYYIILEENEKAEAEEARQNETKTVKTGKYTTATTKSGGGVI